MKASDTVTPPNDNKYKFVLIRGYDPNNAFADMARDFVIENSIVIGGNARGTTLEQIKVELATRIDKNTKIFIGAHGSVDLKTGNHRVSLSKDITCGTGEVFAALNELTTDPLDIILRSCHGGAANSVD